LNDFQADLEFGNHASEAPFWEHVYQKAFPDLLAHIQTSEDSPSQRLGIDRILHLRSGKTLLIDEKKRRGEWSDILLEYVSNDRTGAPGWMEKDNLLIDYLAYAFMPSQCVYLFPWQMLRRAWLAHRIEWIELGKKKRHGFVHVAAVNPTYQTHSVAVPRQYLLRMVSTACIIDVSGSDP
jgi:hypothetical protein